MGKEFCKIDINKKDGIWTAVLCKLSEDKLVEFWESYEEVEAESYADLQFKMADKGFIDKLNNND